MHGVYMAILLDEERQEEINDNEELATFDEQQEPEKDIQAEDEEVTQQEDDGLPDKYKGKTPSEIAKMHQEAEKLLGRQSSEVGELRKIVDDFVKAQLDAKTAPAQSSEKEEEIDWYLDPEKAVEKAISNHPKLKEAEAITAQMRKSKALNDLKSKHPDYVEILQDSNFMEWVQGSKIRTQLLSQADKGYDVDAADELLSNWKERKQVAKTAVAKDKVERKKQVRSASTGSVSGSGEAPSRKIYRRADIIKLMQTDPDRYMQLSDEISKAYSEGRVR